MVVYSVFFLTIHTLTKMSLIVENDGWTEKTLFLSNHEVRRIRAMSLFIYSFFDFFILKICPQKIYKSIQQFISLLSMFIISLWFENDLYIIAIMGFTYWQININFFPFNYSIFTLIGNFIISYLCLTTYFGTVYATLCLLKRIAGFPRIYDLNPCSMLSGFITIFCLINFGMYVFSHWIPIFFIPFFFFPSFQQNRIYNTYMTKIIELGSVYFFCFIVLSKKNTV